MANQNQQDQTRKGASQQQGGADEITDGLGVGSMPESQHNDWGHSQSGAAGNVQSSPSDKQSGNVGGMPGSQHNDWGHSPVPTEDDSGGNRQSDASGLPRQGVMPGEEMGHLQRGQDGKRQP